MNRFCHWVAWAWTTSLAAQLSEGEAYGQFMPLRVTVLRALARVFPRHVVPFRGVWVSRRNKGSMDRTLGAGSSRTGSAGTCSAMNAANSVGVYDTTGSPVFRC